MSREDLMQCRGKVVKRIHSKFQVLIIEEGADTETIVNCTLSGKIRMSKITIAIDDEVSVAISPYDLKTGIINWRY